ncbi:hypothetical protein [Streptomyces fragilis]|uniref:hypothetical protein n=1 Tax=Streptomyces fragilis TaxID=67301 RepID=UPI0024DEC098|nr:hypothetical protein [Streptomyces fragilis]
MCIRDSDITHWTPADTGADTGTGIALATELGQFGPGGRSLYHPRPAAPDRWDWTGDTP